MKHQNLVVYRSVTGFTEQYAKWIAEELDCACLELKDASAKAMSGHDTIIFGGRFHAGCVDGLKRAKQLFGESGAARLVVFATGASPASEGNVIEEAWKNNLTADELERMPHFYMPGGLRYERMPFGDRLMMHVFAAMLRRKRDKSEADRAMEEAISHSYDLSSRKSIAPLVACVTAGQSKR